MQIALRDIDIPASVSSPWNLWVTLCDLCSSKSSLHWLRAPYNVIMIHFIWYLQDDLPCCNCFGKKRTGEYYSAFEYTGWAVLHTLRFLEQYPLLLHNMYPTFRGKRQDWQERYYQILLSKVTLQSLKDFAVLVTKPFFENQEHTIFFRPSIIDHLKREWWHLARDGWMQYNYKFLL